MQLSEPSRILQESMRLMCEEMKVMKTSGVTCAGNDPLEQPGASDNTMNPGSSGYRLGKVQRKCGCKTDYNDEDENERKDREEDDDNASEDEDETLFQVTEAGNLFLETVFGKRLEAATHRKRVQKQESWTPDGPNAQN